jgi:NADH:ubiquinone oxidoreductase subunit 3 (subunit A)
MTNILLTPLLAFVIYVLLGAVFSGLAGRFAAKSHASTFKSTTYSSGEVHDPYPAAPGYRQFFVVALFFAVLHLGVLMVGSSDLAPVAGIYLLGLILALVALILG